MKALFNQILNKASKQCHLTQNKPRDEKKFRSVWLCCKTFTDTIRPVIDKIVLNEALMNDNYTSSFLPHVTLFSGQNLSEKDCKKIMALFLKLFPNGIDLTVQHYKNNPYQNPPAQLILSVPHDEREAMIDTFKETVKQKLGLDITVNNHWLHSSMLYKNVPQPIDNESMNIAQHGAQQLLGKTLHFDQFAITTGFAWEPSDIARWARVKPQSFQSLR